MAETLDISQMLANDYEPKRKFRWILEIDGIDAFTARTASRPKHAFEETIVDFINTKQYFAGKNTWEAIPIELVDPISPSASQKVMQWLRLIHDTPTGRMGYKSMYAKNFSLKLLGPVGDVVEKWNFINGWPNNPDFGELDYKDSEVVTVKFNLRFDEARLEF